MLVQQQSVHDLVVLSANIFLIFFDVVSPLKAVRGVRIYARSTQQAQIFLRYSKFYVVKKLNLVTLYGL